MSESKSANTVQDVSWLVKLSDEEYVKLKERASDFIPFLTHLLIKEAMRMMIVSGNEFPEIRDAFANELMKDFAHDKSLPAKLRADLLKELKEEAQQ